jgi:hypothetical protein
MMPEQKGRYCPTGSCGRFEEILRRVEEHIAEARRLVQRRRAHSPVKGSEREHLGCTEKTFC